VFGVRPCSRAPSTHGRGVSRVYGMNTPTHSSASAAPSKHVLQGDIEHIQYDAPLRTQSAHTETK
jgi:hypothetical protein